MMLPPLCFMLGMLGVGWCVALVFRKCGPESYSLFIWQIYKSYIGMNTSSRLYKYNIFSYTIARYVSSWDVWGIPLVFSDRFLVLGHLLHIFPFSFLSNYWTMLVLINLKNNQKERKKYIYILMSASLNTTQKMCVPRRICLFFIYFISFLFFSVSPYGGIIAPQYFSFFFPASPMFCLWPLSGTEWH